MIESSDKESVTLAEENFIIESFLGIEEFRLGERCEMSFESEITNPNVKLLQCCFSHLLNMPLKIADVSTRWHQ